jgi:predicted ribosome quality control (RQC) complex YloA/Tae2 family protein
VVLTWGQKGEPPPADLREAAAVAAWYSGARHETAVDVRWTRSKYVQKVKGTAGLVRLMKFRTLRVVPARPRGADDAEPEP